MISLSLGATTPGLIDRTLLTTYPQCWIGSWSTIAGSRDTLALMPFSPLQAYLTSPAIIYVTPPPKPTSKPFKFFDFIADHPQFLSIVQGVWRKIIIGNPMFCIYEKLKLLQFELKKLNKKEYSAISERVVQTQSHLGSLQNKLGLDPSDPATQMEEKLAYRQFLTLSRA